MTDTIRALVRPIVALILVGTLAGCTILFAVLGNERALEAAAFIGAPAGFVLEKWFESRRREREGDA
jgi:cell division protein FtsX